MAEREPKYRKKGPHGKWTPELAAEFVAELRKCFVPAVIAHALGISYDTFLYYKKNDPAFGAAVAEARAHYAQTLRKEVHRRAVSGYDKGVYHQGVKVATEKVYSDGLMLRHIARFDPSYREHTSVDSKTTITGNIEALKDLYAGLSDEGRREMAELLAREEARLKAATPPSAT